MTYGTNAATCVKGFDKIDTNIEFSWDMCEEIKSINLEVESNQYYEDYLVAHIAFVVKTINNVERNLYVRFEGISGLKIDGFGKYNQLVGFEVLDYGGRGWESESRFFVNDYERGLISFYCSDIQVLHWK